ncbi:MAG: AGE family epimerase/isomerase [Tannerella sp.]|jgi:mannobiose 2-epimerase|nr:AGE family epimerase/isomerase [Tannerella sp.]
MDNGVRQEFRDILENNILSFWIQYMQDDEQGGFYGRMDGNGTLHTRANKGAVLNARILWTFSAAYRLLSDQKYLQIAQRAFDYIVNHFLDKDYGGAFWELDYKGAPANTKKQTYAQGFMLYGFSEFYRATGDEQALQLAKDFFFLIEKCYDHEAGGYPEAYTREWQSIDDMRLSEKDANEKLTMNTHLHILEPYTNLCRIWNDELVIKAQKRLITIFTEHIWDRTSGHLNLFFADHWILKSTAISYGHDIEASWLLYEAAEVLQDKVLVGKIKEISLRIADAASEGLMIDGSLAYEMKDNQLDKERHWWVQAEAVAGFMYAAKNAPGKGYEDTAMHVWQYIKDHLIDYDCKEWYWSRLKDGNMNCTDDKAGFWKCPYHNGRMCMEMIAHQF